MLEKATLLIFSGDVGDSPVEKMVSQARQAIALDTLEKGLAAGVFGEIIVATNSPQFAEKVTAFPVKVDLDKEPFHFGRRLQQLINLYRIDIPFYIGGGSAPLLSVEELRAIIRPLSPSLKILATNNLYSADFVAFSPGRAINEITLPSTDNDLAYSLHRQAGLQCISLPKTARTQFDADTPTDLMILSFHPFIGHHTRGCLEQLNLPSYRLRQAAACLLKSSATVLVAGRVGSHILTLLETDFPCQTRFYSEERGMQASGRWQRGEVKSLIGSYLETAGVSGFFSRLAELADAAFIDSRVIFHHLHLNPSRADRFYSDLMEVEKIENLFIRDFTAAAKEAPIPVILGGHSLVSGGMLALMESLHLHGKNLPLMI